MKICVVNTGSSGGAAVAARRLGWALEQFGDCKVQFLDRVSFQETIPEQDVKSFLRVIRTQHRIVREYRTPVSNTLFTQPWAGLDIVDASEIQDCDIINLHWCSDFIDAESLQRLASLGKPIVWTLHDQRPFTGGCHYSAGCFQYEQECASCPQVAQELHALTGSFFRLSQDTVRRFNLSFVLLNEWMEGCLLSSSHFDPENHRSFIAPNSLNTEVFMPPLDSAGLRQTYSIGENDFVISSGSMSWGERRKGGDVFWEGLRSFEKQIEESGISGDREIVILAYGGDNAIPSTKARVLNLGNISSESQMAEILGMASVHVLMTREDNLPNTVMESMACGVPVIATKVGGVPEMFIDGESGVLVESEDHVAMANALVRLYRARDECADLGRAAREFVLERYHPRKQAETYKMVFQESLKLHCKSSPPYSSANARVQLMEFLMARESDFPAEERVFSALNWFRHTRLGERCFCLLKRLNLEGVARKILGF